MHSIRNKKGVILIFVLLVLVALMGVALAFWYAVNSEIKSVGAGLADARALYIAEAGRAKARQALTTDGTVPYTETDTSFGQGTYTVTVAYSDPPTNEHVTITSIGYVPNSTKPVAQRQVVEKNISFTSGSAQNLSLNATPSVSSNPGSASSINDGKNTQWKAAGSNVWEWAKLDFVGQKQLSKVVIDGSQIDQYVMEYSNDDINWQAFANVAENPVWTFIFDKVSARYLKFSVYGNKPAIKELEAYGGAVLGQGEFSSSL